MIEPSRSPAISRGQYLAMLAAFLGWMFDGFEMGLHPLAAGPALRQLLKPGVEASLGASGHAVTPADLHAAVESAVGQWNAWLSAIFLFGAAAGGVVFGWLGDRIGRTKAMVYSVLAYTLFTGAGGFATEAWHLAAFRFPAALGMGGEWSLGVALIMEIWPASARPMLAGLIGAAANVGFLAVAAASIFINNHLADNRETTWRPLMFVGVAPALLTFLIRLFVPESEKWKAAVAEGPKPSPLEVFSPGLRWRTFLAVALSGVALLGTWGAVQWVPLWTTQLAQGAPNAKEYSQIWSAMGAIIGSLVSAPIAWRAGRRVTYFAMCLLSLAATGWLFRTPQEFGTAYLAGVFFVGMTTAAFYGWIPLYLPELFPTRIRATGQGIGYNFGRIFAGVGTLVLTGNLESEFKANLQPALAVTSLIYVVGLVLIWFAPETKGKPLPD